MRRRLLTIAIATVLLAFMSVPIAFIIYGGVGVLTVGVLLVGGLMLLQLPLFLLLKRMNVLPSASCLPAERVDKPTVERPDA
ncbi:MAG: hypothetical protein K8T25_09375 [Planctomycetia bacterium]|nr:hypothetical protein [Planctomycetia bacterium]